MNKKRKQRNSLEIKLVMRVSMVSLIGNLKLSGGRWLEGGVNSITKK